MNPHADVCFSGNLDLDDRAIGIVVLEHQVYTIASAKAVLHTRACPRRQAELEGMTSDIELQEAVGRRLSSRAEGADRHCSECGVGDGGDVVQLEDAPRSARRANGLVAPTEVTGLLERVFNEDAQVRTPKVVVAMIVP